MAHHTVRSAYTSLSDRINRFPQGAPPGELLYKILGLLFTEREAEMVALLPIKPFTTDVAAKRWKTNHADAQVMLDTLAGRGILVDIENREGKPVYTLPPPMAGFFEFSLMRVRDDLNQELLAELFHQYINVEEDFIKDLVCRGETQMGRTFVSEPALSNKQRLEVLDYEKASWVIHDASEIGVGMCYCRHKMQHLGRACDAPMDICMTFNSTAQSLNKHGVTRKIEVSECLDLLAKAQEHNLVQFGENVREGVNFICNCCGCCCEALIAARKFGHLHPVHTTNYIPVVDNDACNGCNRCAEVCPVEAMTMVSANDPSKPRKKLARLNEDVCLGCGICQPVCKPEAIRLEERGERVITPLNSVHRVVVMAIERGNLQDLIFDNRTLTSHRALAALFGAILKLSPVKRALASKQMKSRYLEYLVQRAAVQD